MPDILAVTTPIFILIGLGFLSARAGLLSREQFRGIGTFVISFALPALLVKALGERPVAEVLNVGYLLAYGLASLAVFAGGFAVSRWLRKDSRQGAALAAMGMSVSNSGFIGYPVVAMVLGAPAALAMALGMLVENLLMIPLAMVLAESGRQRGAGPRQMLVETARRLARNPMLAGIGGGLALSLLELSLPPILQRSIDLLAQASAPAALFVIGGSLYGLRAGGMLADIGQVALGKLVLHPLAVFAAFALVPGLDPTLKLAGLLFASAPMMSIYPILGQQYGLEQRCAAALVAATALSFFSMSALLGVLPQPPVH